MKTQNAVAVGFTANRLFTTLLFALVLAPVARATVTNVVYYLFGKNDPGAANGVTAASTTDLRGGALGERALPPALRSSTTNRKPAAN